jgi:hypothetical protein
MAGRALRICRPGVGHVPVRSRPVLCFCPFGPPNRQVLSISVVNLLCPLTIMAVPKVQIYQQLAKGTVHLSAETTLLVMTMQLLARPVTAGPADAELYLKSKKFFNYLETRNQLSLKLIQAGLLLAVYEIGHAIYPSAYLTVGHCARLAQTIGINDLNDSVQMFPPPRPSASFESPDYESPRPTEQSPEAEENRRTWWAIIVLDRCVRNLYADGESSFSILS